MSDSKKRPIIEIGDTVVFRTDLEEWKKYGGYLFDRSMIKHSRQGGTVKRLSDTGSFCIGVGYWFPAASVAEVLKPSKARVYSEEEMKQCWKTAIVSACSVIEEDPNPMQFKDFIESLNTEGK